MKLALEKTFSLIAVALTCGIACCGQAAVAPVQTKSASPQPAQAPAKPRKLLPLEQKLPPLPPKPKKAPLTATNLIVRVNGVDITYGAITRQVDMMAVLLKNKVPTISADKVKRFKERNIKRFSDDLFRKTIFSTCLAHSNIVATAATRTQVENEFRKNYGAKGQTMAQLKDVVAKAGYLKDLEADLETEARILTFVTTVYSNRYYISEAVVDTHRKNVEAFNQRAAATNELNLALAGQVAQRAKAGEDFAKLADQYSQDPEKNPGGSLGECDENDFGDDKNVWRALLSLKPGAVTPVLEIEDGYAIYKLLGRVSAEESNSGLETLKVSRIFFRRAFQFPEQSREEFRADIERELREKLFGEIYMAFRRGSKVERPNGDVEAR